MYQLSSFLCKWMYRENVIRENEMEVCQYGLQITMANMINFLIMLIIGVLCHSVWEMGFFYAVFISLRLFCGGYHADSYGKCFLMFGLTCLAGMMEVRFLSGYVNGLLPLFLVMTFFLGACIYKRAPIEHVNRPLSDQEKGCFKKRGLTVHLFWCITGIFLWYFQLWLFFSSIISAFIMVLICMFIKEGDGGHEKKRT